MEIEAHFGTFFYRLYGFIKIIILGLQVATALLVAGPTLTFWIPGWTVCIYQLVLKWCSKAIGCLYNCRWLADGLFQLTHVIWWPCCSIDQVWASHAAKTKMKHYYSAHNIATRVSFGT